MLELEDARRTALSARQTEINVQLERVTAWIALYKAMGGGWTRSTPAVTVSFNKGSVNETIKQ